jgi:ubiquinone/menaquinone biosynthesis C-methylase UbiE
MMNSKSTYQNSHDTKVGAYFDKASTVFDTFYDHKRNPFMQWVDRKFRSDVFIRYQWAFETLEPLKDKTVLDIGCGSGPYVVEAAKQGSRRVVGLDMAQGMIDLGLQRATAAGVSDRCEFILGSFPACKPSEVFDHAIVMGVMDYIKDPLTFLKVLSQEVRLCVVASFPSRHWFRTSFRKFRYWLKRCPVYFYDSDQIKKLSEAAGFKRIDIRKIPGAGMDYFVILYK